MNTTAKIQVFVPASLRGGEREMYTLLRKQGVPEHDAVRVIQNRRSREAFNADGRESLREQNSRRWSRTTVAMV